MDYKGDISGFPVDVVEAMLDQQENQGNERNVSVFENNKWSGKTVKGFDWADTPNDINFWERVIVDEEFSLLRQYIPIEVKSRVLAVNELKSGAVYFLKANSSRFNYIFLYDKTKINIINAYGEYIQTRNGKKYLEGKCYRNTDIIDIQDILIDSIREATPEETLQLAQSIKAKKIVELNTKEDDKSSKKGEEPSSISKTCESREDQHDHEQVKHRLGEKSPARVPRRQSRPVLGNIKVVTAKAIQDEGINRRRTTSEIRHPRRARSLS